MLDDMNVRRFTPDTQRDYIRAVKKLAAFLGRSPDTATAEDLRAFRSTGRRRRGTCVFVCEPRKLPRVLAQEEFAFLAIVLDAF